MAANDEYNSMQANMGLVGSGTTGPYGPQGVPTPQVRHPGEVSAEVVQRAQAAAYTTATLSNPIGPMGSYAQQYKANMAQISSQHFNPIMASYMGGGFQPGVLPTPSMVTSPDMGIFRPFAQPHAPIIPSTPHMPLVTTPFTPQPTSNPMFSSPMDYSAAHGYHRGLQYNAAALAAPGVAAHLGANAMYGGIGAGVGAHLGARFGGVRGAAVGSLVGMAAGFFGSEASGLGSTAGSIADGLNPFRQTAIRGAQMRSMSQDWVVGGSGMNFTGRGLSTGASMSVGRQLEDLSWDSGFKKETGNRFSTQDLTRMTQMAGQSGMMDMAQSPQAITAEVKKVAKAIHAFGQIAGDPDIANAIKSLSQMRAMGMSYGESLQSLQNAKSYARMGGTSVQGIMEQGRAGALTFQQMGMSGGLGFNVGMGAYGMAGQAVAGGTFTTSQLAMLGGKSGIAQRDMESSAAMLKMPMMAAAAANFGGGGTFGLNGGNVSSIVGGGMNIGQMATMGADNLLSAVQKGGVGALGMFMAQQGELQDSLGRAMGPVGLQAMKMRQVQGTMKMMGLEGPQGFVTAAQGMGMDGDTSRQLMQTANSPEYFRNIQRQFDVMRQDERSTSEAARAARAPGFGGTWKESSVVARGLGDLFGDMGRGARNAVESINDMFVSHGEVGEAIGRGRKLIRNPASLGAASNLESRMIAAVSKGDLDAFGAGLSKADGALFRLGGRGRVQSELVGDIHNVMGGDAESYAELMRAEGGFLGMMSGNSVTSAVSQLVNTGMNLLGDGAGVSGDDVRARGKSIQAASRMVTAGRGASTSERAEAGRRAGKKVGKEKVAAFSTELAKVARSKDRIIGKGGSLSTEDLKAAAQAAGMGDVDEATLKDLMLADGGAAESMAGQEGFHSFRAESMEIGDAQFDVRTKDGLLNAREKISDNIFGENGWLESDEDRSLALGNLFGQHEDSRVAVLASLKQAAADGETGAAERYASFRAGFGDEDKYQELSGAADTMLKGADSTQKRYLRRAGVTAMGTKSNVALNENFKKAQQQNLQSKAYARSKGWDTDKEVGGAMGQNEAGLNKEAERMAALGKDMAGIFPASVQTFSEASRELLKAANRLGSIRITDLAPGDN